MEQSHKLQRPETFRLTFIKHKIDYPSDSNINLLKYLTRLLQPRLLQPPTDLNFQVGDFAV